MSKNIEIELRYEITDQSLVQAFLDQCTLQNKVRLIDVYLDTPNLELYKKGIFIRFRNNKKLEVKFNRACLTDATLALQDHCEEHSFPLPMHPDQLSTINELFISLNLKPLKNLTMVGLIRSNSFIESYAVDKVRTTYTKECFTIALDEVKDLGAFLEIELMTDSLNTLDEVKDTMQAIIKELPLVPLKTGYGTLLLRKHNFNEYLQGRFILPEDIKYKHV